MNIIFDYDGTLHNTALIYNEAVNIAYLWLSSQGYAEKKYWAEDTTSKFLGMTREEMWAEFMPNLDKSVVAEAADMIGREMIKRVGNGHAELYTGIEEVLDELKQNGNTLIILSNCHKEYMEAHIKRFNLDRWFSGYYCSSEYPGKKKSEIFKDILSKYKGKFCVVGDRKSDIDVGTVNGLMSIGCRYGFGTEEELKKADKVIKSPLEIPDAIKEACK